MCVCAAYGRGKLADHRPCKGSTGSPGRVEAPSERAGRGRRPSPSSGSQVVSDIRLDSQGAFRRAAACHAHGIRGIGRGSLQGGATVYQAGQGQEALMARAIGMGVAVADSSWGVQCGQAPTGQGER